MSPSKTGLLAGEECPRRKTNQNPGWKPEHKGLGAEALMPLSMVLTAHCPLSLLQLRQQENAVRLSVTLSQWVFNLPNTVTL